MGSFILGGRRIFLLHICPEIMKVLQCFATFGGLCWIHDDIGRIQMSKGVRFTFAFCQSTTAAITHLVNDLMSFPFEAGGRYQSAALHTMERRRGYRRYNGNIQWRPAPAGQLDCPLTPSPPLIMIIVVIAVAWMFAVTKREKDKMTKRQNDKKPIWQKYERARRQKDKDQK